MEKASRPRYWGFLLQAGRNTSGVCGDNRQGELRHVTETVLTFLGRRLLAGHEVVADGEDR